jgi:autotransporter-associated beta strand protein
MATGVIYSKFSYLSGISMRLFAIVCSGMAVLLISTDRAGASTIWSGPTIHFEKADGADGSLPANQDQLTADVVFARGISQGLYNAATESFFTHSLSPSGTQWENGTTATINPAAFTDWNTWFLTTNGGINGHVIGQPAVVYLVADDIYLNLTFTSWASGHSGGAGGFAYDRSTPSPSGPAGWIGGTSGNWSVGTNWSGGTAPNGAGQAAALTQATTATVTATLDTPVTLGILEFGNSGGNLAVGYNVSGTNALTLDNSGSDSLVSASEGSHSISAPVLLNGNLDVSPSANATLTISGNIRQSNSGSSLTLATPGTLILSGSNGYSGGTIVKTGTLEVENSSAIASGTSLSVGSNASSIPAPIVPAGAAMSLSAAVVPEPSSITLIGAGALCLLLCYGRQARRP